MTVAFVDSTGGRAGNEKNSNNISSKKVRWIRQIFFIGKKLYKELYYEIIQCINYNISSDVWLASDFLFNELINKAAIKVFFKEKYYSKFSREFLVNRCFLEHPVHIFNYIENGFWISDIFFFFFNLTRSSTCSFI